jgi:hypothetical protein
MTFSAGFRERITGLAYPRRLAFQFEHHFSSMYPNAGAPGWPGEQPRFFSPISAT